MDTVDKNIKAHLFICCRNRQNKACCAEKNAEELVKNLKLWTKSNKINDSIKVSQSSCLGLCEDGITACLYPQNQWFTRLELKDEEKLKEILTCASNGNMDK
jgi:(2Fe-2S) ferredoxin